MKKARITFLLALLTAFFAVSLLQAQTIHEEWTYDVKCSDGLWIWCLEEPVEGIAVYNVVYKVNEEGEVVKFHANIKGGKLVGCETGTVYKIQNSWNDKTLVNKNNDQQVWNYVDKTHLVAPKGVKYTVLFKGKFTANANGEIILDNFSVDWCH
jgi:hypothetical protein